MVKAPRETIWRRAYKDTEGFRQNSPWWFWGLELVGGLVFPILSVVLFQPQQNPSQVEQVIYPGAGLMAGVIVSYALSFGWNAAWAASRQRNEAWNTADNAAVIISPLAALAAQLAARNYYVGGKDVPGDELFRQLAPQFSSPVSEAQLEQWLYEQIRDYNRAHPESLISGEVANKVCRPIARDIIQDWFLANLFDSETIHRPGTPDPKTGHFRFIGNVPNTYAVYTLGTKGRDLFAYLTSDAWAVTPTP